MIDIITLSLICLMKKIMLFLEITFVIQFFPYSWPLIYSIVATILNFMLEGSGVVLYLFKYHESCNSMVFV